MKHETHVPSNVNDALMASLQMQAVIDIAQKAHIDGKLDFPTYDALYQAAKKAERMTMQLSERLEHDAKQEQAAPPAPSATRRDTQGLVCVSIEGGALAVLLGAAKLHLRFATDLQAAGCQEISQDDLEVLRAAIQTGQAALGKEEQQERDEGQVSQRFIARKLPEPTWQEGHGLGEWELTSWEMWDTVKGQRAGRQRFATEQLCNDYAAKWSRAYGPPACCGACGHVFADGESSYGHEYYGLLCYHCSAAKEG